MKKIIFIFILLNVLAGCSSGNGGEQQASGEHAEKVATEKPQLKVKDEVYVPNPQITDDLKLTEAGQTISDDKGKLTLKAYKKVNEPIKVGPMDLTVKEVKVMHFVPDYSMIDFFHSYTQEEEFDVVKIGVEFKNTSKEKVKFTPIAQLKMNSGEHKMWEDDIYLEELNGEIAENGDNKGNIGFILTDTNTEDIKSVELLTSDAVDKNGKSIEKGRKIKIDF
ncbi:DUF4352 domain-containing protein [Peribacillus cavernae]|uniref:DUF4352 domain-containing protein n=1 Tax=Peribacillus cavernae TaxID=1674310 RepID=A0A3S0VG27_9BACI|nr:DUF4352 domain-containing protein [Peribacillus cavernae]MDQ0218372.1 hypothetical protein [Peribacillus cavernae]RUQ31383.1 DUF4352 domain-containing protein [Peribacillus cavernae]